LNPAGLLFKLYRDHFGTLPVAVSGDSPQPPPKYPPGGEEPIVNAGSDTYPLDVAAALSSDRKTLTVAMVNPTESGQQLELAIQGIVPGGGARWWRMAPSDLNATILVVGQQAQVRVEEQVLESVPKSLALAPFSVNLYEFPLR